MDPGTEKWTPVAVKGEAVKPPTSLPPPPPPHFHFWIVERSVACRDPSPPYDHASSASKKAEEPMETKEPDVGFVRTQTERSLRESTKRE